MEQIERTRAKGESNYDTTSQKEMHKSMRNMAQLTREYNKAAKEFQSSKADIERLIGQTETIKRNTKGDSKESKSFRDNSQKAINQMTLKVGDINKQMQGLEKEYRKAEATMEKLSNFQQTHSKAFKGRFRTDDIYNLPKDYKTRRSPMRDGRGQVMYRDSPTGKREPVMTERKTLDKTRARRVVDARLDDDSGIDTILESVKSQTREATKLGDRSRSQARRAVASEYMSHQQSANFQKDYQTTQHDYVKDLEENRQKITDLGLERDTLTKEARNIETSGTDSPEDIDRLVSIRDTIREMTEEMKAREKLDKAIQNTRRSVEKDYQDVLEGKHGKGTEVKPERGTMRGMMYERAPAIGLAATGAVGLAVGGLYQQGEQAKSSMRDDVISIGQRTEQDNWRQDVRNQAQDAGLEDYLGFAGQEMLDFQNNYLSNRGYQDLDDLNDAMSAQAEFSRSTGLDAQTTSEFFDGVFSSAKIQGGDVKGIQDGFLGAIKQSGMEGREKEQLDALQDLIGVVGEGRTIGSEDIQNIIGLQSVFAQSDSEALKGEQGGQLLANLHEGIQGGIDDPQTRLLFGMGGQFQGIEGYAQLAEQLDKGISDVDNVNTLMDYAEGNLHGQGSEDEVAGVLHRTARSRLGVDMSMEEAKELVDLSRSGELSQENLDKVLEEGSALGEEKGEEGLERYQDSKEALENQSEATTEKQATRLNDFGDALKKANTVLGKAPTILYGAGAAVVALGASALATAASFAMSAGLRGGLGGIFGKRGSAILDKFRNPKSAGGGGSGLGGMVVGGGDGKGKGGGTGSGKGGGPVYVPGGGDGEGKGKGKKGKGRGIFGGLKNVARGLGILTVADMGDSLIREAGDGVLGHEKGDIKAPSLWDIPRNFGFKDFERYGDDREGLFGSKSGSRKKGENSLTNSSFFDTISSPGIFPAAQMYSKFRAEGDAGSVWGNAKEYSKKIADGKSVDFLGGLFDVVNPTKGASNISKWIFGDGKDDKSKNKDKPTGTGGARPDQGVDKDDINVDPSKDPNDKKGTGGFRPFSSSLTQPMGDITPLASNSDMETSKRVAPQVKSVQIDRDSEDGADVKDHRDRENSNRKERTEGKRGDNISGEGSNLDRYEVALRTAESLLLQARMQNGIMGDPDAGGGTAGGGNGLGGYPGGDLRFLPEGQKWDNPGDLTRSDLRSTDAKLSAEDLDNWINSKAPENSIMRGMGESFFKAGQESGLDPRYLVAHAAEETGWGTSNIAKKKNNWFGIGAFDNNPMGGAYSFDDRGEGIVEGAKWIAKNYYDNGETNLQEMNKRYATNPQWASNIAGIMGGAPSGTGSVQVDSKVTVNMTAGEDVLRSVNNSSELEKAGKSISNKIYNSMNFFAKDMRRA